MVINNNKKSFINLNKSTSSIGIPSIFFKNKSLLNFNQLSSLPKNESKNSISSLLSPQRSLLHEKVSNRLKKSAIVDQSFHDEQKLQACKIIDSRKRKLKDDESICKSRKLCPTGTNVFDELRSINTCNSNLSANNRPEIPANNGHKKSKLSPPKICIKLSKSIDKESILRDEQFLLNPYLFEERVLPEEPKNIVKRPSRDSRDLQSVVGLTKPETTNNEVSVETDPVEEKIINLNVNNNNRRVPVEIYKTKSIKQLLTEIDNHRLTHGRTNLSKSISQRFANIKSMLSDALPSSDSLASQTPPVKSLIDDSGNNPLASFSLSSQKKEVNVNPPMVVVSKSDELVANNNSIINLTKPAIVSEPKSDKTDCPTTLTFLKDNDDSKRMLPSFSFGTTSVASAVSSSFQFSTTSATLGYSVSSSSSSVASSTQPIDQTFSFSQSITTSKPIDQSKDSLKQSNGIFGQSFAPSKPDVQPASNIFTPSISVSKTTEQSTNLFTSKPVDKSASQSKPIDTVTKSNDQLFSFSQSITTSKDSLKQSNDIFAPSFAPSKPIDQPLTLAPSVSKSTDQIFPFGNSITTSKPIEQPLIFGQSITTSKPIDQPSNTLNQANTMFGLPNVVSKPADQSTKLFGQSTATSKPTDSLFTFNQSNSTFGQTLTAVKSTDQSASIFGQSNNTFGQSTVATSNNTFGQTNSTFGQSIVSSSNNIFGQSTAPSINTFVQSTVSSSNNMFGQSTVSSSNNMFGQSTTPSINTFGQSTVSSSNNMFGQSTVSSSNNIFGQSTTPSINTFGQSTAPSINTFGQSTAPSTNTFGQSTVSSSNNMFGQSTAPLINTFGQSTVSSSNNMFGQSNNTFGQSSAPSINTFGQSTVSSSNSTFGQTNSTFGHSVVSSSNNMFGQSTVSSSNNMFGQSTTPSINTFGQSTVSSSNNMFGQSTAPSINTFGQSTVSSSNNMFGQSNNTFGQSSAPSINTFGQSVVSSSNSTFGQSTNTFGKSINTLGQSNTAFGSSINTFGQSIVASKPSDQSTNIFNQSKSMPSFTTFGQSSSESGLFGQNGTAPAKPADAPANLFGQSSQPATLFGQSSQPATLFGSQSLSTSSPFAQSNLSSSFNKPFGQSATVSKPESSIFGASTAPKSTQSTLFGTGASVNSNSFVFGQSKPSQSSPFTQNGSVNGSMTASTGSTTGSMFPQQSATDTKSSIFGSNQLNSVNTTGSTNGPNQSSLFGSNIKPTGFVFGAAKSDNINDSFSKPTFAQAGSQNAFGVGSLNKSQNAFSFNSNTAPVTNSVFNATSGFNFGQSMAPGAAPGFNFGLDSNQSQTTNMFSAHSNPNYPRKPYKKRK